MIDTHIHFWRYTPADYPWISDEMPVLKQDRLPEQIARDAKRLGVSQAIAVQARCCEAENEFLLSLAEQSDWVSGVVGWLDLTDTNIAETLQHYVRQPALKGLRHLVQDEPNPAEYWQRTDFQEGVRTAQKLGLNYDLLCHQHDLDAVLAFARTCDEHWLILDHLGKPNFRQPEMFSAWQQSMRQLAQLEHVAVKISGLVTEYGAGCSLRHLQAHFDTALELFGTDRIMWGSD